MSEHKKPLTVGVKRLDEKKPKREQREITESSVGSTEECPCACKFDLGLQIVMGQQKDIERNQIVLMATVLINTLSILLLSYLEKHP